MLCYVYLSFFFFFIYIQIGLTFVFTQIIFFWFVFYLYPGYIFIYLSSTLDLEDLPLPSTHHQLFNDDFQKSFRRTNISVCSYITTMHLLALLATLQYRCTVLNYQVRKIVGTFIGKSTNKFDGALCFSPPRHLEKFLSTPLRQCNINRRQKRRTIYHL